MYAAIIAGGSGTRLWPQSRQDKPKQFHKLYGETTLLQQTVARLEPIVERDNFYVIANEAHKFAVASQMPWLPEHNFVGEPLAKNTAPAIGIIATLIAHKDPDAVILVTPSDHVIQREEQFHSILAAAEEVATRGANVVTIGIKPTYPETGYGYIQMTEEKEIVNGIEVYRVESFKEKPDNRTAEEYVSSWQYVWNAGMFVWSVKTIMQLYRDHAPDIYKLLLRYDGAIGTEHEAKVFEEVYEAFPSVSVDYAIMEHAKTIHVIPAAIGWSDLGCWSSVYDIMDTDEDGNAVTGQVVSLDTHNSLIHAGDRLICTVGLDNMLVIDTDDVVMIMPKGRSQEVKALLDEVKKRSGTKYI